MKLYATVRVEKEVFTQMCENALALNKPSMVKEWEQNLLNNAVRQLTSSMLENGLLKLEWENYDGTKDPYYIYARVEAEILPPPDHPDAITVWQGSLYCQDRYRRRYEAEQAKDEPMDEETIERIIKIRRETIGGAE